MMCVKEEEWLGGGGVGGGGGRARASVMDSISESHCKGLLAAHDEMMYCQKASLVHSP